MTIEIAAHKRRVLDGHTEAQALHLVDIGHILEERGHYQIGAAVGHGAAEAVKFGKLISVVAAGAPFQGVQIHCIGDAEILKGTQQLAVNGLRQADFRSDPVAEVGQHALAVHTLRSGGQAQEDLGLIVGQQLLIGRRRRVMELVHHDVVVKIRCGLGGEILRVEGLNG